VKPELRVGKVCFVKEKTLKLFGAPSFVSVTEAVIAGRSLFAPIRRQRREAGNDAATTRSEVAAWLSKYLVMSSTYVLKVSVNRGSFDSVGCSALIVCIESSVFVVRETGSSP
jgi:hypothetical protein